MSDMMLVNGDHDFLKRRFVRTVLTSEINSGRKLVPISGNSPELDQELDQALSMASLFDQRLVLHITESEKIKDFSFTKWASDDVLILFESKKQPRKLKLDKRFIKTFKSPPFFKLEEAATDFFVEEVKSKGHRIDRKLALFVVRSVGSDFGVLSFEALKASCLSDGEVSLEVLRSSLAPLSEVGPLQIIKSLEHQDLKGLVRSLDRYKKTQKSDPTILLCGRWLSPLIFKWLQAVSSKQSLEDTAQTVGANPWYWKNKICVPAKKWGTSGVYDLFKVVSEGQQSVLKGQLDPWNVLKSGLIRAITSLGL